MVRKCINPGIHSDMPNEVYHRETDGISHTGLKDINISPATFKYNQENPKETDNSVFVFGRAFHTYILEPEKFDSQFIVVDKIPRKGSKERAKFDAENTGKDILKTDDLEALKGMKASLENTKSAHKFLSADITVEESFFWIDERTGVKCKCRTDFRDADKKIIGDLKSCTEADPAGFRKAVGNFNYHQQNAFYKDGVKAVTGDDYVFIFIAVEKKPPYLVKAHYLGTDPIEAGRDKYIKALRTYKWCMEHDNWPGYEDKVELIEDLPPWCY